MSGFTRVLAVVLLASLGSMSGCSQLVVERYRYACSLSEADLAGYRDAFAATFPAYSFEDFVNECDSGSAQGVVFQLAKGDTPPTDEAIARSGCVRFRERGAVDDVVYRCAGSSGNYELILEDVHAYVNPLAADA